MKNSYIEINKKYGWISLLEALENQDVFLLNKGNSDFMLGWDPKASLTVNVNEYDAAKIQKFIDQYRNEYVFTSIAYDLKNDETRSASKEYQQVSSIHFMVPSHVIISKANTDLYFGKLDSKKMHALLEQLDNSKKTATLSDKISLSAATSQSDYIKAVKAIKDRIQAGIIYEMNYCIDFESSFNQVSPTATYKKLIKQSNAPFSAFVSFGKQYILCASPERFLLKKGNALISQPIKGTAKRGNNTEEDQSIASALLNDQKEISENVMIVDLVRNDLSKVAVKKSVNVLELCKLYSFETVHQLISTVACELKENSTFTSTLQALFPMGSMTGAPKISAIEQIDVFESFERGIYSGTVGYIEPNGNFDLNVVIRTILIDSDARKINCRVGGAITIHSIPEKEHNECLLKLKVLQSSLC